METTQNTSYVYGVEAHTLCMAAIAGDSSSNRFALGTLGTKEDSEIHLVDFNSDEGTLASLIYRHSGALRSLASAPWDPAQMLLINGRKTQAPVELVHLPQLPEPRGQDALSAEANTDFLHTESVSSLQLPAGDALLPHRAVFHPDPDSKLAAAVSASSVYMWDLAANASPVLKHSISAARNSMDDIEAIAWHPADASQITTTDGSCVRMWDMRLSSQSTHQQQAMAIEYAHSGKIRAVDYNPNLPYILATGGDDGVVRAWDTRSPASALMEIANHSHWVYALEFNPNHDQLLLSAGSDGLVNLESVVSVSSAHIVSELGSAGSNPHAPDSRSNAPESMDSFSYYGGDENGSSNDTDSESNDGIGKPADGLVMQFDDHETSVYAAHWSASDPWIFASLSFGGRLVINAVPREEKYKILL
ncbi:Protein tssc1 [Dipsacomyces acuminosporus]|nr:Protein tssc1 [Dipsacomyces acuminosporus]